MTDELLWALKGLKWKSIEKDNMEFEIKTTCYVRDIILKEVAMEERLREIRDQLQNK